LIAALNEPVYATIDSDDMSLRRGPRGLPDWPFWNGLPRRGLP